MFELVLAGHPVSGRRRIAAPAAIAVHVLVLGGFLAFSAWKIGDVPEPRIPISFVGDVAIPSPPATPGAPPGEKRGLAPRPRSERALASPAPLALVPSVLSPAIASISPMPPAAAGPDDGATPDDVGGTGGTPGGIGTGSREGIAADGVLSERTPNVVAPRLLLQVEPRYPEAARHARQQGLVVLQAVIGTGGGVEDIRVLSSASPLFEEPAIAAVRQWRYAAATLDRRAVRVYLTVTIRFTLH